MATPSPLLALFKEQLEAECESLAKKHGLKNRGDSWSTGISFVCMSLRM